MPYLLDTNHCIYLMNGWKKEEGNRKPEEQNVIRKVLSLKGKNILYMSEATLGELYYGACLSKRKSQNMGNIDTLRQAVPPLPASEHTWKIYGETKATLKADGKKIPDMDLVISATAKEYGLTIVSSDTHLDLLPDSFERQNWAT